MKILLLAGLLLLAGCADTVVFRVVEYGARAMWGELGGCAVHQTPGAPETVIEQFEFEYKGERCTVRAIGK